MDNIGIANDGFKWVVYNKESNKAFIVTDLNMVAKFTETSISTLKRRIESHGDIFEVNNYKVMNLPYFKSMRGNSNG